MWYQAGNPGGLLSTDLMVYGGEMYFSGSGTITNGTTLASFEPVTIGSYELSHTASAVAAADEGPKLSLVGSSSFDDRGGVPGHVLLRRHVFGHEPHAGSEQVVRLRHLGKPSNGHRFGILQGPDRHGQLDGVGFRRPTTGAMASSVPLLLSGEATTTTFNGWEVSGCAVHSWTTCRCSCIRT